jgi:hypothetical protein
VILDIALGIVFGVVLLYLLLGVSGIGFAFLGKLGEVFREATETRQKDASVTYNAPVLSVRKAVGNEVLDASDARWANMEPTQRQIALCKKLGINILSGATRQEVSATLNRHFVAMRSSESEF